MRSFRRAALLTAAALALGATGCGGGAGSGAATPTTAAGNAVTSSPGGTAGSTEPQAAGAAAEVPEPLRFTAAGVDGAQVVGADFAGKDVALWFWAPW